MKKPIILFFLLFSICSYLYSQDTKDILFLKNGNIIYGSVFDITDTLVKIRTSDQSVYVFKGSQVEKFIRSAQDIPERKAKGAGFSFETGFLIGSPHSQYVLPFSFNAILNFTIAKRNIFGIGSGVEFIGQTFTPLFAEYKYLLTEKRTTPFIFVRGGGLFYISNNEEASTDTYPQYNYPVHYKGGGSFTLGTGISWVKQDFETYLTFAYRHARTSYEEESYLHLFTAYKNNYNRLELKFGFKF
jgi:hypothetical protein